MPASIVCSVRPRPEPGAGSSSRKRAQRRRAGRAAGPPAGRAGRRCAPASAAARSAQTPAAKSRSAIVTGARLVGEGEDGVGGLAAEEIVGLDQHQAVARCFAGKESEHLDELELVVEVVLEPQLDRLEIAVGADAARRARRIRPRPPPRRRGSGRRDRRPAPAVHGGRARRAVIGPSCSTSRHGSMVASRPARRRSSAALSPLVMIRSVIGAQDGNGARALSPGDSRLSRSR